MKFENMVQFVDYIDQEIAIVGLGYVGLPLAKAFDSNGNRTVHGIDTSAKRLEGLLAKHDATGEISDDQMAKVAVRFSSDIVDARNATAFIVTVPTPVDEMKKPDLSLVEAACRSVGTVLKNGDLVVFESTVYPGVTERICGPILEQISGLRSGVDFFLGYSPERINPGDKVHTITKITKVVSGQDEQALARVVDLYGSVIEAGLHQAPSIMVAEAAKVIENTQRDVNIALMNELSLIFERVGVRTSDVLKAAGSKWNFLNFYPGLVGGHCIGVDPYYLTSLAEQMNYHPQVITAGRRINDLMAPHVAQRIIKQLVRSGRSIRGARVGVLGLTFKENVPDFRNSKVFDIIAELEAFGVTPVAHDPFSDSAGREVDGVQLVGLAEMVDMDAVILAVKHDEYVAMGVDGMAALVAENGVFGDVLSVFDAKKLRSDIDYWSL